MQSVDRGALALLAEATTHEWIVSSLTLEPHSDASAAAFSKDPVSTAV